VEEARFIKAAQRKAIPGLAELDAGIKAAARAGDPIRTWGGRLYYTEEPKMIDGRMRTFEYKLLNYLIQGSAADCTKEAVIRFDEARRESRFLVTVHDEINISAPAKAMKQEMQILREVMASVEFDAPMISDGKVGKSWGTLTKFKEAA
jgi:DNA polymerase I-like protein with 3'-5' exonuclease and polymerase domains